MRGMQQRGQCRLLCWVSMARKVPPRGDVNRAWFEERLSATEKNMADLARHLKLDPSAVSRMFKGERWISEREIDAIARFLHAPPQEVERHAGQSRDATGAPTGILLAASVNARGEIERMTEPRPLPQVVIEKARAVLSLGGQGQIIAAQIRAPKGPLTILDDAVILFQPTDAVELSAIGALSICRNFAGKQIIAKIVSARKTGEARLVTVAGEAVEFDLHTATPIIAIIP